MNGEPGIIQKRERVEKYTTIPLNDYKGLIHEINRLQIQVMTLEKQLPWWRKIISYYRGK